MYFTLSSSWPTEGTRDNSEWDQEDSVGEARKASQTMSHMGDVDQCGTDT